MALFCMDLMEDVFSMQYFSFLYKKFISCFLLLFTWQEELRPFFSLPKVMDGLFGLAKMLFDINIEPADGIAPVT